MDRRPASSGFSATTSSLLAGSVLSFAALALGWRGADWPAQLYRADLFARVGFTQWDNQWYGGHHTPGYSLLFPPLGAVIGVATVATVSGLVAAVFFARMATRWFEFAAARVAAVWFAAGTVTNIAVGRVTFALGLAIALGAVGSTVRRSRWAVPLALLAPLASPVAGAFVALAGVAITLAARDDRAARRLPVIVALAAALPIAILSVTFPEGGRFPFRIGDFAMVVGASVVIGVVAPRAAGALRWGTVIYGLSAVAIFVVPNPLGGNLIRLATFVAGPVLAGLLWPQRKKLLLCVGAPLLLWQWYPAVDGIVIAGRDPSSKRAYFAPLLEFLDEHPLARIEIPFTKRHWEAAYVAPQVALARGWERQLDLGVNPIFYEPGLTASRYGEWLSSNAISYVALPDAELDYSAVAEAALLRAGLPNLQPVWHSDHWRVWEVTDARAMVDGPARMAELEPNWFALDVEQPGDILVRIRYSSHWDIEGAGCVVASPEGWTLLRTPQPGRLRVRQVVSRWVPFRPARTDECPSVTRER